MAATLFKALSTWASMVGQHCVQLISIQSLNKVSQFDQLKQFTKVAADTADFESIRAYDVQEGTTNPSLILAAAQKLDYASLSDQTVADLEGSKLSRSVKQSRG